MTGLNTTNERGGSMKSLQRLAQVLLLDVGYACRVDTAMDWKTVHRRIEHEGDEFLTITLPTFGKDFDRSLDQGGIADDLFSGFHRRGGLPVFLQGFLQLVFDSKNGTLLVKPSLESISSVRQFTMAFGKIFENPSEQRTIEAMRNFIRTEEELRAHEHSISDLFNSRGGIQSEAKEGDFPPVALLSACQSATPNSFLGANSGAALPNSRSRHLHREVGSGATRDAGRDVSLLRRFDAAVVLLYGNSLSGIDPDLRSGRIPEGVFPQHGTGATADRRKGNEKFALDEWPDRLERVFPFLEWALPSYRHHAYQQRVNFLTPEQERPVRVIAVPKTAKTPRIIAIEPTAMQYMQQALGRYLVNALERDALVSPMLGFRDQQPNQLMAREGSITGTLATLDLSEASDRVLNLHVERLFKNYPGFSEAVQACRSSKADVQGHGIVPLAKFASMGSGLTFPIEAMVFLAIVVSSIASDQGVPITARFLQGLHGRVRIYGDDIIVPVEHTESVIADLETFGLVVNRNKSFWTGQFRESCGGDFYAGEWVTPVRVRSKFPTRRKDAEEIASLVSLRNQFYEAGRWTTARFLDTKIRKFLPRFPIVEETSVILGRSSAIYPPEADGWCADRHVPLVKGYTLVSRLPDNSLDDVYALMKWFLARRNPSGDPLSEDHLQRSGRANSSHISKIGWHRPY